MDKTKPFGLVLPKRAQTFPVKTNAAFDSDSDDEPARKKAAMRIPQAKPLSKKLIKVEQCEDPSIYEYDSIYDDMKAKEVAKTAPKSENKPSRYIESLLKAAEKRKKNSERRLEKKVQIEREKEGEKFKDKESFVTSAYKKKMQEMEEEEERERRETQLNDMMDVTKQNDLSGFYRHFLKQSVGEEKVPVFGERMDIKIEPGTEPDTEKVIKEEGVSENNATIASDLDQDSDIVSSSDEETPDSRKDISNFEGIGSSKPNQADNSSDESNNKVKKSKPRRQIRKKTVDDNSDDESETFKSKVARPQRQLRKRTEDSDDGTKNKTEKISFRKKPTTEDSDSSSESSSSDEGDQETETTKVNNSVEKHGLSKDVDSDIEATKIQERKNMFEKRTVGSVFADAQARYFQRMAARSA